MAAPVSSGTATIAGFAVESATDGSQWPAIAAAQVTERWPIVSADFDPGMSQAPVVTRAQTLGPTGVDVVSQAPSVRVAFRWRYQGLDSLLACALGYMPAALPTPLGTTAYRHLYEVSADLEATPWPTADAQPPTTRLVRRGTFAAWRQVSTWEVLSCMVQSLALVSDGERVTGAVTLVGAGLSQVSTVNTAAALQALPGCGWPLLGVRHGRLRLGLASPTTPLSSANDVCYSTCAVRLDNQLAASYGPRTGLAPEQYGRTTPPALTLTVDTPRYLSDAWLQTWQAQTTLMGELRFLGPQVGGSGQAYQLTWYLPALRLTDVRPSPVQVGLPSVRHVLQAEVPAQPAAGMPATAQPGPVGVEVVSGARHHPLL